MVMGLLLDRANPTICNESNVILDSFKPTGFEYLMDHRLPQNMIDPIFFWVSPNDCTVYPNRDLIFYFPSRKSRLHTQWRSNSLLRIGPSSCVNIFFRSQKTLKSDGDDSDTIRKISGTINTPKSKFRKISRRVSKPDIRMIQ
jgi:hypothetical protein